MLSNWVIFYVPIHNGANLSSANTTSLLLVPGYIVAVIVGALSGKIGEYLNSKQAIITAIILIALSLILPAFAVGNHISIFVISMIFFAGSFALMYAPLLNEAIKTIDLNMTGVAIGFICGGICRYCDCCGSNRF